MRVPAFPMVASFVLLAVPAFAQSGSMTGGGATQNPSWSSSNTGTSGSGYERQGGMNYSGQAAGGYNQQTGAANQQYGGNPSYTGSHYSGGWHQSMGVTTDTRDKLQQSLEQSGFKNVRVTPQAFLIRAQAPDGSRIVMMLRPDELTGVVEQTGSSSGPGNWSSQSSSTGSGSSNWNSGASNTGSGLNR